MSTRFIKYLSTTNCRISSSIEIKTFMFSGIAILRNASLIIFSFALRLLYVEPFLGLFTGANKVEKRNKN
jgi:hypothetical protein